VAAPTRHVPFSLHRDYLILVEGSLGPLKGLRFAIDTGSVRTVVCRDRATSLGFRGVPTSLITFGERVPAFDVEVSELTFGPIVVKQPQVLVTDLTQVAASLGLRQLDGLIGLDVLRFSIFAVDFGEQRLVFGARQRLPFTAPFSSHPVLLVVDASLGAAPVRLTLDSGVSHLVLFTRGAPGRLLASGRRIEAAHLAGTVQAGVTAIDRFHIGRWSSSRLPAVVLPVGAHEPTGTDGALGLRALGANYVQFDFERREVGWRP